MVFSYWNNNIESKSEKDSNRIEQIQLEEARIVTGLTVISSRESLYLETGWEPLINRRQRSKLVTMFKIYNNFTPSYLNDIMPDQRSVISNRQTRNSSNYDIPRCRLELYKKSVMPSVVHDWNCLSMKSRSCDSLKQFKKCISNLMLSVPEFSLW